jgi:predicted Zn-dependent protease
MPPNDELVFCLAPWGEIPEWVVSYIAELVMENFGARAARLKSRELPPKSYLPEKKSYNANHLLDILNVYAHENNWNIIGITAAKIYDKADNSKLYGYAFLGGPTILISLPSGSEKPTDEIRTIARNTLLHELGHFFGLTDRDCERNFLKKLARIFRLTDRGQCLMNDKAQLNTTNFSYCAACRKKIDLVLARKEWQS